MKANDEVSTNLGQTDPASTAAASAQEATPQAAPNPQKKTVSGFAKAWLIFWFIGNIAAVCAPINKLSGSLGGLVAMVMLLAAITAGGYFLLLYKNPTGLYMILVANILGLLMNSISVPGYTINVQTGLVIGIITYFVTRKQVAYPFWKPAAAN